MAVRPTQLAAVCRASRTASTLLQHRRLTPAALGHSRAAHTSQVVTSKIPSPTPFVPDVPTFLKLIGRSSSQFASKLPTWETLFGSSPEHLRKIGIEPPRARRYLLRWRDKFRHGAFGPGGDLTHVSADGEAELRIVIEPSGKKVVLNTPVSKAPEEVWKQQAPHEGVRVPWAKVVWPGVVSASHAVSVKGTEGRIARIKIQEGMWEDRKGHKIGGGERFMTRQKTLVERRKRGVVA